MELNKSIYDKVNVDDNFLTNQVYSPDNITSTSTTITTNRISSELNESFMVINTGKNLEELDKVEYNSINSQNNYHYYTKIVQYAGKIMPFAGSLTAVSSIIL